MERLEPRTVMAAAFVISEFLASNDKGIVDQDGEHSDWIEITNVGDTTGSLAGYYLTDDQSNLTEWQLPDVQLAAGQRLLVFASDKNRAVAGSELHTNFKLSADGEYLALVRPNLTIASAYAPFPIQRPDISFGIGAPDTSATLLAAGNPTQVYVPTDGSLDGLWYQPGYTPTGWTSGTTGVGYSVMVPGFAVRNYKANVAVTSISVAQNVIATPSMQTSVVSATTPTLNFIGTGASPHFPGDTAFPGGTINVNVDDFVITADAMVTIPSAGQWTFGVNSDDGFRLSVGNNVSTYPGTRGSSDTLATFTFAAAGEYKLRLEMFDRTSGSQLELFAAQGSFTSFAAAPFRLVGDVANGGLAVRSDSLVAGQQGYSDLVQTNVQPQMLNQNASIYTRTSFHVELPSQYNSLTLQMKYDDGFVAYLNGQEIARRNAPTNVQWNSTATTSRSNSQAVIAESIDLSSFLHLLQQGNNILAIQGLNDSVSGNDLLLAPELKAGFVANTDHVYFTAPTPNAANSNLGLIGFVAEPTFSHQRGFYTSAFDVSLTTATPGAQIRYTLDGSTPTSTTGLIYTGAIQVTGTTIVRSAAFRNGYLGSEVSTQTYLFLSDVVQQSSTGTAPAGFPTTSVNGQVMDYGMDPDIVNHATWGPQLEAALKALPTLSIVTDLKNMFDPTTGIYVNADKDGRLWERSTSLELINAPDAANPNGSTAFQIDAGIRIRGGFSRSDANPKHSFRLFFRDEYGADQLEYPLFGDEGVSVFDNLDLRTDQNYSWAFQNDSRMTLARDPWSDLAMRDMDQPYSRSKYIQVYIDGQYWGIYAFQERPEASYAESYFGGDKDNFDVVKADADGYVLAATDGNLDAWTEFWNISQTISGKSTQAERYAVFQQLQGLNPDGSRNLSMPVYLDTDNLIDYMTTILFTGNLDAPISNFLGNTRINNWFGIRDRTGDQGFVFVAHDNEHTLLSTTVDRTGPWNAGSNVIYSNPQWIHQQLMNVEEYRVQFMDRIQMHFGPGGVLTSAANIARHTELTSQLTTAIIAESARWGDAKKAAADAPFTQTHWQAAVNTINNSFFPGRQANFLTQLRNATTLDSTGTVNMGPSPLFSSVAAATYSKQGGVIEPGYQLVVGSPGGLVYYTLDGSDPRLVGGGISPTAQTYVTTSATTTLIAAGEVWKYKDDGSNQGTAWQALNFDDSSWLSGNAELGYGDGGEAKIINGGPTNNRIITTYFRKTFTITELNKLLSLDLGLLRDDGAVVYINGQEVFRSNMPTGTIAYNTFASSSVSGANETTFFSPTSPIPLDMLVEGTNVITVELHQDTLSTSDASFNLRLNATKSTGSPPIVLNGQTTVKSRAYSGGVWSALNEAVFSLGEPPALKITELNYNPQAQGGFSSDDLEFVELMNTGTTVIKLSGIEIRGGIDYVFGNEDLAAGQRIVVARNRAAFQAVYGNDGSIRLASGVFTGSLSNGGEQILLRDSEIAGGAVLQDFTYDDAGDYPTRPDGSGSSLEVVDPDGDITDPDNWRASVEYGGTPGRAGIGALVTIVVNEVLTNTDGVLTDTIELYNTSAVAVDLSGWYLSDNDNNFKKYRIADGTVIAANGYLVFNESHFNPTPLTPAPNHFALSSKGDDVYLMSTDAAGNLKYFIDHVNFGAANLDESFGRWPNGSGDLLPMASRTLGTQNSGPRVGPVIISELMVAPATDDLEFIELHNTTGAAIDLSNWKFVNGVDFTFAAGSSIAAHGTLLVVRFNPTTETAKLDAFRAAYGLGTGVAIVGGYTGALKNDGETIELDRPGVPDPETPTEIPYTIVDLFAFSTAAPWPTLSASTSLSRASSTGWGGDAATWKPAAPTAGAFDLAAPTVMIAAVTPDPRTTPISEITISFNEAVSGFDLADLQLSRSGGANLLASGTFTLTTSDNITWVLGGLAAATTPAGAYTLSLTASGSGIVDASGNGISLGATETFTISAPTTVIGRHLFYNNSAFDGFSAAVGVADDGAIAADKTALLPGQASSFANYSSYVRGINGLMIDFANLSSAPQLSDFNFRFGNTITPDSWEAAPAPTLTSRAIAGGVTRITLVWPDNSIRGKWLQVTVKAAGLGMVADDVFYFGNSPGESGNSASDTFVDIVDYAGARDNPHDFRNKAQINDQFDFNRDQFVDITDMAIARDYGTSFITALKRFTAPTPPGAPQAGNVVVLAGASSISAITTSTDPFSAFAPEPMPTVALEAIATIDGAAATTELVGPAAPSDLATDDTTGGTAASTERGVAESDAASVSPAPGESSAAAARPESTTAAQSGDAEPVVLADLAVFVSAATDASLLPTGVADAPSSLASATRQAKLPRHSMREAVLSDLVGQFSLRKESIEAIPLWLKNRTDEPLAAAITEVIFDDATPDRADQNFARRWMLHRAGSVKRPSVAAVDAVLAELVVQSEADEQE